MPVSLQQTQHWLADNLPASSRRNARARRTPNPQPLSLASRATLNWLLLPLCLVVYGSGIALADPPGIARDEHHSLSLGTAERRAILDTLRAEVRRWHQIDVVFVVEEIRVIGDWAWVQTRPQSADGLNHYEDIAALLHRQQGQWQVVELAADTADTLRQRFPDLPTGLLESR